MHFVLYKWPVSRWFTPSQLCSWLLSLEPVMLDLKYLLAEDRNGRGKQWLIPADFPRTDPPWKCTALLCRSLIPTSRLHRRKQTQPTVAKLIIAESALIKCAKEG